jgi:hypothetical protein
MRMSVPSVFTIRVPLSTEAVLVASLLLVFRVTVARRSSSPSPEPG